MRPLFVAEVSSNHHQNLQRCLEFIDRTAEIGCDAVKFQLFRIKDLFAPEILKKSERHRAREAWELPEAFIPKLADRCRERNIQFSCTPFYLEAVDFLEPYVDFYKIASYELLWDELLIRCAATGKPVVLSTGMATMEEVRHAVSVLKESGCVKLTLLHCVSEYPTQVEDCNLSVIETLRQAYDVATGWSDHSVNVGVIDRAVHRWEASMIEFHLDLEGKGAEYEMGHCWLPEQIQRVIQSVHAGIEADGSAKKEPRPREINERDWRADPVDGLRPIRSIR